MCFYFRRERVDDRSGGGVDAAVQQRGRGRLRGLCLWAGGHCGHGGRGGGPRPTTPHHGPRLSAETLLAAQGRSATLRLAHIPQSHLHRPRLQNW